MTGLRPVVCTIPFTTTRCFEQIRTGVAYHESPVVIVGNGVVLRRARGDSPFTRGFSQFAVHTKHESLHQQTRWN